jgi:hypothetical protein
LGTVENSSLVGFTVTGPGFRDDSSFNYNFQVVQTDSREINGASLWITASASSSASSELPGPGGRVTASPRRRTPARTSWSSAPRTRSST